MDAFERGRAAWPNVSVERAQYAAHVAALGAGPEHAEDLFLACGCAAGDAAALAAFDARFLSQVPKFIARLDSSAAFAEEVTQILRVHFLVASDGRAPRI